MVGIVGILLLGSLAWSAIGALVSAVGAASSALTSSASASPVTFDTPVVVTPSATPEVSIGLDTDVPSPTVDSLSATPTVDATVPPETPTPTPRPAGTPTAVASGRNPWILLPQPEPGAKVAPGATTVEARGRGDAPIKSIQLELDGVALAVTLEQRSDSTWRGFASTRVNPGQHDVRAGVTDANGRTGSYHWNFSAG